MAKYLDATGLAYFWDSIKGKPVRAFETVADMQAATDLEAGNICRTNGFHAAGDGGAAYYTISSSGTANGMDVLACQNDMKAALVYDDYMSPVCFGATHTTDCSVVIQRMLNSGVGIDGHGGTYIIENMIVPTSTIRIRNCAFDFNDVGNGFFTRTTHDSYNAPTSVFSDYILIEGCEFKNAVDYGIASSRTTSYDAALPLYAKVAHVKDSSFYDNRCHGLMLYADLTNANAFSDVRIENCRAYNNGVYDAITHSITKTGIGIGAYLDANNIKSKITITGCEVHHNANSGIAPHGIKDVVISDCVSHDNNEHGFVFQTNKSGVITNCIASSNFSRGIRIQGDKNIVPVYCKNVTVTNCVVSDSRAMRIGGGVENVLAENNIFNVNDASTYAIDFDPDDYPDKNLVFVGNAFNGTSIQIFGGFRACDLNVYALRNTVNGVMTQYVGYDLKTSQSLDFSLVLMQSEPNDYFFNVDDMLVGSAVGGATFADGVLTATSNSGYIYKTFDVSAVHHFFAYALGQITNLGTTSATGWLRFSLRNSSNTELASLSYNTQQITRIVSSKCNWCLYANIDEMKETYPTLAKIRVSFVLTAKNDSIQFDALNVLTA